MEKFKESPNNLTPVSLQEGPMLDDIVEEVVKINGEKVQKTYKREGLLGKGGFA